MLSIPNQDTYIQSVLGNSKEVLLLWADGGASRFSAVWLRHNCPCSECLHEKTGQRHITMDDVDSASYIASTTLRNRRVLEIEFGPTRHLAKFLADDLFALKYDYSGETVAVALPATWDAEIGRQFLSYPWADLKKQEKTWKLCVLSLATHGYAMLRDVPAEPNFIETVAALFGRIKENRVGRVFDVRFDPDPSNLAFTAGALAPHTDNPYRNPIPGFQFLHCLTNSRDGGESFVADGFRAAEILKRENPEHYALLSAHSVLFRYRSADTWFEARAPLIELDSNGVLKGIRYNDRSLAPIDVPADVMDSYYDAYRHFSEILRRDELQLLFKMGSGDLYIVDNQRVLHGRRAFPVTEPRFLQACYMDRDWIESHSRLIKFYHR
jgi:[2-(trimethylamino)ethyl]phosphonate dioxygenase